VNHEMRIAVISDIHGNCVALDAALADITKHTVDRFVCLGDTVQGGPQPNQTIKRLREVACPIVLGNADAWLLKTESDSAEPTSKEQREVRDWTLSKLSSEDLDFLCNYQPTVEIILDHTQRLICFHGSPLSYDDVLLPYTPKEKWDQLLGPFAPAIMTGGHTHTQQVRRIGEGLFFNPGSVGVAYNYYLPKDEFHTEPWAEYAILSYEQGYSGLEFRRAYYDLERMIQAIRASGRPHADHMIDDYRKGH
jgi:putative phosphoesterase